MASPALASPVQIFVSKGIRVVSVLPAPVEAVDTTDAGAIPILPSEDEPSDHLMIGAVLELDE